jgi:hypothetical protein
LDAIKEQIMGCKLGDINSYDGNPLLSAETRSWIRAHAGEVGDFGKVAQLCSSTLQEQSQNTAAQFLNPYSLILPTKIQMLEMATMYFASESHKIFPVFSRDIAFIGIEQVYQSLDANICVSSGRATIFTMIAFFSIGDSRHPWLSEQDGHTFSDAALQLLPEILREGVTLGGFGAVSIMVSFWATRRRRLSGIAFY